MTTQQEQLPLDAVTKAAIVNATEPDAEVLAARVAELEAQLQQAGQTMIEFKAQVRSKAMEMAEAHNLCSVVENTLASVGINVAKVKFEVVQTIERYRTVEVPEDLWNSITEEQLAAYVFDRTIPAGRRQREFRAVTVTDDRTRNSGTPTLRPVESTPLQRGPERGGLAIPAGYIGVFTSHDGRSMHLVFDNGGDHDERPSGTLRGLRYHPALCSVTSAQWRRDSRQDTGRMCRRCAQRAGMA